MSGPSFYRDMNRFSHVMRLLRFLVPAWFAGVVFGLDFPLLVHRWIGPVTQSADSPGFVVGTLPAMFAMVGLWWAAYPAERAMREQTLLAKLEADLPVRSGPTLWQYLLANTRLQLLFLFAPVLCILAFRDVLVFAATLAEIQLTEAHHLVVSLASMLPVMLVAPVLLVRILPTAPLPPSPLRDRLEELCRNNGLRVSNILLWKTGGNIGNAAVMGMLPRCRYLLVTDLLLETLPDEQILSIFAHEIGHIVHRHLLWMAACAFALIFAISGPAETALDFLSRHIAIPDPYGPLIALAATGPLFLFIFGWVVRRLERQADVFAARTIPQLLTLQPAGHGDQPPSAAPLDYAPEQTFVRGQGAGLVCGALKRVALVNNVPVNAHEWLHGSIAWRMGFLKKVSDDPEQTKKFDRLMRRLYAAITLFLKSPWAPGPSGTSSSRMCTKVGRLALSDTGPMGQQFVRTPTSIEGPRQPEGGSLALERHGPIGQQSSERQPASRAVPSIPRGYPPLHAFPADPMVRLASGNLEAGQESPSSSPAGGGLFHHDASGRFAATGEAGRVGQSSHRLGAGQPLAAYRPTAGRVSQAVLTEHREVAGRGSRSLSLAIRASKGRRGADVAQSRWHRLSAGLIRHHAQPPAPGGPTCSGR